MLLMNSKTKHTNVKYNIQLKEEITALHTILFKIYMHVIQFTEAHHLRISH